LAIDSLLPEVVLHGVVMTFTEELEQTEDIDSEFDILDVFLLYGQANGWFLLFCYRLVELVIAIFGDVADGVEEFLVDQRHRFLDEVEECLETGVDLDEEGVRRVRLELLVEGCLCIGVAAN
jgi:hypothetical protein